MKSVFKKCVLILKDHQTLVVPREEDQLVQIAEGVLYLLAIGSVLFAI